MNIIIQSINFKMGIALEVFIKEQIGKLFRLSNTIESVRVILRQEENKRIANRSCEIRLVMPGNDPIVKRNTEVYEKSVFFAVQALQNVLGRKKNRKVFN